MRSMAMLSAVTVALLWSTAGYAQPSPEPTPAAPPASDDGGVEAIDRVVVRWYSRATGGVKKPRFITARELAFAARIEALTEGTRLAVAFSDKHVRVAIQRHVTETMLANLPVDPKATPKQVATYAEAARAIMAQTIGAGDVALGSKRIDDARRAEGLTNSELDALLRRRARASWYLDRMVAPMLRPSELDLREVHRRGETPFTEMRFDDIEPQLRQWYVSTNLASALDRYFRNARSRVRIYVIERSLPSKSRRRDDA